MAVILKHPVDDEHAEVIHGRPDFVNYDFGVTHAKKFPPYVFSIRGTSCLVHRVRCVECRWYRVGGGGELLVKLKQPLMIAVTMCGSLFRLLGDCSRTCNLPAPDAVLCGRCHGEGATFPKRAGGRSKKGNLTRTEAHVKLGCVVNGY